MESNTKATKQSLPGILIDEEIAFHHSHTKPQNIFTTNPISIFLFYTFSQQQFWFIIILLHKYTFDWKSDSLASYRISQPMEEISWKRGVPSTVYIYKK